MEKILLIVTAVAGVLQIVLFFKIWAMTNNVKVIKNRELDLLEQAQLFALKGDRGKAYEMFYDNFLREVIEAYNGSHSDYNYIEKYSKIKNSYSVLSKELGFNNVDFGKFDNKYKVAGIFLTK